MTGIIGKEVGAPLREQHPVRNGILIAVGAFTAVAGTGQACFELTKRGDCDFCDAFHNLNPDTASAPEAP